MVKLSQLKHVNFGIIVSVFVLCVIGALTIFSTTFYFNKAVSGVFASQLVFYALGFLILFASASIHYSFLKRKLFLFFIFLVTVSLLILVIFAGETVLGARRWISIGNFFVIQPSELAKVSLILLTAYLLSKKSSVELPVLKRGGLRSYLDFGKSSLLHFITSGIFLSFCVTLIFAGLTAAQNSLGNALLIIAVYVIMLMMRFRHAGTASSVLLCFFAGCIIGYLAITSVVNPLTIAALLILTLGFFQFIKFFRFSFILTAIVLVTGVFAPIALHYSYNNFLQDYQRNRVESFINPEKDADLSWNREQSLIACGSGRFMGKGFMNGTQSASGLLPFAYTDFAFCGFAEQFGFLGVCVLMGTLLFLILRIVDIGFSSYDSFGSLLCFGVAALIFTNSVQHIGMNTGVLPITGVPLPLISSGGSAILTTFIGLGLVMSIYAEYWNKPKKITKIDLTL